MVLSMVGLYRQCRGEWKLARVALTMSAGRVAGLVLRATFQSPLQLRGEVQGVINRVYTGGEAQGVINGGLYRQVWA